MTKADAVFSVVGITFENTYENCLFSSYTLLYRSRLRNNMLSHFHDN